MSHDLRLPGDLRERSALAERLLRRLLRRASGLEVGDDLAHVNLVYTDEIGARRVRKEVRCRSGGLLVLEEQHAPALSILSGRNPVSAHNSGGLFHRRDNVGTEVFYSLPRTVRRHADVHQNCVHRSLLSVSGRLMIAGSPRGLPEVRAPRSPYSTPAHIQSTSEAAQADRCLPGRFVALTAKSLVLVTPQKNVAGVWVQAAVKSAANSRFTVFLNKTVSVSYPVARMVIEKP